MTNFQIGDRVKFIINDSNFAIVYVRQEEFIITGYLQDDDERPMLEYVRLKAVSDCEAIKRLIGIHIHELTLIKN